MTIAMALEPTIDQLDAAWQELRRRGYRSCLAVATLAEAMAAPIAGSLVRMHARLAASGVRAFVASRERPSTVAPEPLQACDADAPPAVRPGLLPRDRPTRAPRRTSVPRRKPAPSTDATGIDRKRAAAGDRDDD